jgi:proton glutamate symport protein
MNPALRVFAAFVVGLVLGMVALSDGLIKVVEPIGTLWINALRMPIIPLIVALTISGVASVENARQASALTLKAILVFVALLVAITAMATPLAPVLLSGLSLDAASTEALRASVSASPTPATRLSFLDWALSLVPTNPLKAAADGALLPLVIFSIAYGLALTKASSAVRDSQVRFLQGVADTLIVLIRGVLFVAPVGVFALSYVLGARVGTAAVKAVALYIVVMIASISVVIVLLYLLAWLVGGVPLKQFAAALLPAQAIALSSRSSLAALPALIEGMKAKLQLSQPVMSVVLPLGASIFKINSAVTWSLGAVLISVLYGVHVEPTGWLIFGIGTVLLSFTTPGIPSGGFLVQAPLYATIGLPVEGMGILIAIDLIPDVFKTASNVTGYATAAALVNRWSGGGKTG